MATAKCPFCKKLVIVVTPVAGTPFFKRHRGGGIKNCNGSLLGVKPEVIIDEPESIKGNQETG